MYIFIRMSYAGLCTNLHIWKYYNNNTRLYWEIQHY